LLEWVDSVVASFWKRVVFTQRFGKQLQSVDLEIHATAGLETGATS
jgi:hypothetical protein